MEEPITQNETDAQVLWNDVVTMLSDEGFAPSTMAMFKSCTALDLTDNTLILAAGSGFVRRNIEKNLKVIETCIEQAAFQPIQVHVELEREHAGGDAPIPTIPTKITQQEFEQIREQRPSASEPVNPSPESQVAPLSASSHRKKPRKKNPLVENITATDSQLTFDSFIEGEENQLALQAAKAVANGSNGYNPLFIYGKSGLGKTHLLKAIQNYLAVNDASRICIYRQARDFVNDYASAMVDTTRGVKAALEQNYHDIDVLIIDDIQGFRGAAKSIDFFFDTFNYLTSHGKQIVLAADESPSELGLAERVTSRLDSGVTLAVQVPNYELKFGLIKAFYSQMKASAQEEQRPGYDGVISDEDLEFMASRAGSNIRMIKSFCQSCLFAASTHKRSNEPFGREQIAQIAEAKWGREQRTFSIDHIQHFIEQRYGVSHADLVSSKRKKELMEPRHVAIWLVRELTDSTLAQIGEKFGGRTHATIKHSIKWVEDRRSEDRIIHDKISRMKEDLLTSS